MAAPATTGVLRTKVSDMQIGDYIVAHYFNNGGGAGTLAGAVVMPSLGINDAPELPVNGSATPNGLFYFVKVAKGLLIADRICQNTISWDTLNGVKVIQGMPWSNGNIIPTMTSNTAPSGVAIRNDAYSSGTEAWYAFDKNTSAWQTKTKPSYLGYQFTSPTVIRKYTFIGGDGVGTLSKCPTAWTFEGSNDGLTWTVLDTQTGKAASSSKQSFFINNKTAYAMYRMNISNNNGDVNGYTAIVELEMMDTVGILRSLTGGVSFADVNGNSTPTNPGSSAYGGWPVNNEWDKYIVNFDSTKIQSGKVLDDVFHWSNVYTLCQDTPINGCFGIGTTNTYRSRRGDAGAGGVKTFDANSSSTSGAAIGLRPVFEYTE